MGGWKFFIIYLLALNLISLVLYGWDKYRAVHHAWRIPEKTLLLSAALGGSAGALLGMKFFHHKTLHWKFRLGVPGLLLLQLAGIFYFYR